MNCEGLKENYLEEDKFYKYIFPGWRTIRTDAPFKKQYRDIPKKNTHAFWTEDGRYYPARVIGKGIGMYRGQTYIEWYRYTEKKGQYILTKETYDPQFVPDEDLRSDKENDFVYFEDFDPALLRL